MERRKALKNMGLALGYSVATPTLIHLVQSCKNERTITWAPQFFTPDQGAALTQLVDIILPKTDTPSASEMQVDRFIDRFAFEVMEPQQQDFTKLRFSKFLEEAMTRSEKKEVTQLKAQDLEKVLQKALEVDKQREAENFEVIHSYNEAIEKGVPIDIDDEILRFSFASDVRGLTIWGYKTSEFIGEKVLAYLPVPGQYVPCGNLEELTGGKAWSL
ncbi:MAG: gluconate 2-dehydrogenase subunit 3 family protein [Bacteroidota bacterium]